MAKLSRPRIRIPKSIQVQVFRRDLWLCQSCLRPVIFPPALKLLELRVRSSGYAEPLAYWNPQWRRDAAPLLDELAASVDHVVAHALGGSNEIDNLATICARCNARKGKLKTEEHLKRNPLRKVKGKHGEPIHWDGLASVFMLLTSEQADALSATDKGWLAALSSPRSSGKTR